MKKHLFLALGLAVSSLTGCARMPTQSELAGINYGEPVLQDDAERRAKEFLGSQLKHPYSAVYTWQSVTTGWVKAPPLLGGGMDTGWILKGMVNAKNSFGGYVGAKPYQFMFREGALAHVWTVDAQSGILMKIM